MGRVASMHYHEIREMEKERGEHGDVEIQCRDVRTPRLPKHFDIGGSEGPGPPLEGSKVPICAP